HPSLPVPLEAVLAPETGEGAVMSRTEIVEGVVLAPERVDVTEEDGLLCDALELAEQLLVGARGLAERFGEVEVRAQSLLIEDGRVRPQQVLEPPFASRFERERIRLLWPAVRGDPPSPLHGFEAGPRQEPALEHPVRDHHADRDVRRS